VTFSDDLRERRGVADSPFTLDPTSDRGVPSWDDPGHTVPPGGVWGAARVFAVLYIGFTVFAAAAWIWATSVAGLRFFSALGAMYSFLAIALVWFVLLIVVIWRLATASTRRPGLNSAVPLLVVASIGVALVVLTVTGLPVRARFEFARSDFDAYAAGVLAAAEGSPAVGEPNLTQDDPGFDLARPETPPSLGGIEVRSAMVVPEGLIIFDEVGALFDDAGYAYLPSGQFPAGDGSFESPQFRSLGGGWYSFVSSW